MKLTRRQACLGITCALAAAAAGICLLSSSRKKSSSLSYRDALFSESLRSSYARHILGSVPDHVQVMYATPDVLLRLKHQGYTPPQGAYAGSRALENEKLGNGSGTEILLYPEAFFEDYQQHPRSWNDLELIIENVLRNHERVHARHFHDGFERYSRKQFLHANGRVNLALFLAASELEAHREELQGLKAVRSKKTSGLFDFYLQNIPQMALPHYLCLFDKEITKDADHHFLETLKADLNPERF